MYPPDPQPRRYDPFVSQQTDWFTPNFTPEVQPPSPGFGMPTDYSSNYRPQLGDGSYGPEAVQRQQTVQQSAPMPAPQPSGETPKYRFRNRSTGEVVEMEWYGQQPPTREDIELYQRQQEGGSMQKAWEWANKPLTDAPSRAARWLTSHAPDEVSMGDKINQYTGTNLGDYTAAATGFMKGAVEGAGDLASSFTSPLSIGLMATTGGAGLTARAGMGAASKALSAIEAGAGAGLAAHGGYRLANADNWQEAAWALPEIAGGVLGARGGYNRYNQLANPPAPPPITDPTRLLQAENPQLPPSKMGPRFYAGAAGIADAHEGVYTENMSNLANPFTENAMNMTWGPEQIGEQVQLPAQIAAEIGVEGRRRPANPMIEPIQPEVFNPVGDPNVLAPGEIAARNELPAVGRPENRRGVMADVINDLVNEELNKPRDAKGMAVSGGVPPEGRVGGMPDDVLGPVADPNAAPPPPPPPPGNGLMPPAERAAAIQRILNDPAQIRQQAQLMGVGEDVVRQELQRMVAREIADGNLPQARGRAAQPPMRSVTQGQLAPPVPAGQRIGAAGRRAVAKIDEILGTDPIAGHPDPDNVANPRLVGLKLLAQDNHRINQAAQSAGIPRAIFVKQLKRLIKEEGGFLDVGVIGEGLGKAKAAIGAKFEELSTAAKKKFSTKISQIEKTIPEAVPILHDWMGKRAAAETRGVIEGEKFRHLDAPELEKVLEYQKHPERFPEVAAYFKSGRERAIDADLALGLKENYLPQLWDNTPEEISAAFAKKYGTNLKPGDPLAVEPTPKGRVTMKPTFTLKSVIENYKEGMEMGLKPKIKNISELVNWYEKSLEKAKADREFFFTMRDRGLIRPAGKAPHGWEDLKSDYFPSFGKKGQLKYTYKAHPDIVKVVENYIKQPTGFWNSVGDVVQTSKDIAMSSGMVPGTALNAHGLNILARTGAARGVIKGTLEGIGYLINTGADNPVARKIEKVAPWQSAKAYLKENLKDAPKFVEKGLNMSTEGFKFGEERHTNPFLKLHGKYFEDPLFQNMVPALKLKHVKDITAQFMRDGMSEDVAMTKASKIANETFGGINIDMMFRDKSFQTVMRSALIAPDWLESNARVGVGMGKALVKGGAESKPYKQMAAGFFGSYLLANAANKFMSGHFMWQNDPGHTLQIDTGQTIKSGNKRKKVHINPFGTAFDAIRLPAETVTAAAKGDLSQAGRILKNRASMPAASFGNFLYNEDWRGRELGGKTAFGKSVPFGTSVQRNISNLTDPFTPQYLGAAKEMLFEGTSFPEAIMGAVEAPVRFSTKPRPKHARR